MKIEYCERTGLLFVNEVAIATDMIVHLHDIIVYDPQFNCNVIINDKVNKASVGIGKEELIEIDTYIANNNLDLVCADDFETLDFNFNLN